MVENNVTKNERIGVEVSLGLEKDGGIKLVEFFSPHPFLSNRTYHYHKSNPKDDWDWNFCLRWTVVGTMLTADEQTTVRLPGGEQGCLTLLGKQQNSLFQMLNYGSEINFQLLSSAPLYGEKPKAWFVCLF